MVKKSWLIATVAAFVLVGSVSTVFATTTVRTKITVNGKTIEKTFTSDKTMTKTVSSANVDLACMQKAVDKRDGTLVTVFSTYDNAITSALSSRQAALKAAWGVSNTADRQLAIRKAWNSYRTARHTARKTFNTAKNTTWDTFMNERKACRGSLTDDGTNSAVDIEI